MTIKRRDSNEDWPQWLHVAWQLDPESVGALSLVKKEDYGLLRIQTLEGSQVVKAGDWIIQGVKGEIYPCDNDIFMLTYENAEKTPGN